MTDAQFLSNNSVICAANHIKFANSVQDSWSQKVPNTGRNRTKFSPLLGGSLPKVDIFNFWGPSTNPPCNDWREILHCQEDPSASQPCQISGEWCNESPLRGENADFQPLANRQWQFAASRHFCRQGWNKR